MKRRPASRRQKLLLALCAPLVALLLAELSLRCCGYPTGRFAMLMSTSPHPYPPSAIQSMDWGVMPYTVRSNSLGLRGEEIAFQKPASTLRIVTIGDSVTDGFFVDNEDTWQYPLRELLSRRLDRPVEVVNCAHGGGSIDKQLFLLRRFGLPLAPDVVILTFVSNDISDILGRTEADLTEFWAHAEALDRPGFDSWVLTRTAIGEALLDLFLSMRSPVAVQRGPAAPDRRGESRYVIPGGDDFAGNAARFRARFADTDGLVLGDELPPAAAATLSVYLAMLAKVAASCREHDARLLFVYFPAYTQVYDDAPPRRINDELRAACAALEVDFLDLTDGFRAAGRERVLHLAPLDFHPNPDGNRLFARLVGEHLARRRGK